MAILEMDSIELLMLSNNIDIDQKLLVEIEEFFDEHFDYNNWKRKGNFWYHFNQLDFRKKICYEHDKISFDNETSIKQVSQIVAWIISILKDENSNEKYQKIAFELSCIMPNFWQVTSQENIQFSDSCKKLAVNYLNLVDFNIQATEYSSINERENLDFLEKILTDKNWQEIANNYWSLKDIYNKIFIDWHTNYDYLLQHHFDVLLDILNKTNSVWKILWLIARLKNRQIIDVLIKTDNQLVRFLLLNKLSSRSDDLDQHELLSLSELWGNLDNDLLKEWLFIFNKFPTRHKVLQCDIGKFLCNSHSENIQIYIDSLDLNSNYQDISDCIQYFLSNSTNESREYFCELSFEKWKDWQPERIYKIFKSVLDEVIIYYFQYYCDEITRGEFINKHLNEIFNAQNRWFANETEFNQFVEFHLSKIQPVCMANELTKDTNLTLEDVQNKKFTKDFFQDDKRWQYWLRYFDN